ncbi:MAG: lamin tail domain-containing protein [Alphaproteobacteria bacterium]|nr:lamin tail domain-containing protein [Alphaproteobacteria bacterium]
MRTVHFLPALALLAACAGSTPDSVSDEAAAPNALATIEVGAGDAATLPSDQLAPPGVLRLASPDDFVLGTQVRVGVLNAPPGAPVFLIGSLANGGTTSCPPQLAPTCLNLFNPVYVLGQTTAAPNGRALFLLDLPANLPLVTAHLQAASRIPGDQFTSNILNVTFQAPVDTDTDTDTDLPPTVTTIADLRSGAAGVIVGDQAQVDGLVITAVGTRGFTAQDPSASINGGIYVYHNGELSGFNVGDTVSVVGEYDEYGASGAVAPLETLAELKVLAASPGTSISVTGTGATTSPVLLSVGDAATPAIAETYEGMLVNLEDSGPLEVVGALAFDEFPVAVAGNPDSILIDNEFFSLPVALPDLDVGATFDSITGPMYFSFSNYKVAPRSLDDVTGYTPPAVDSDSDTDTDVGLPGPDTLVPGDLVITEFMANPSGCSDTDGEYFEVLYRGSTTVDLGGLIMEDSANTAILAGPVVANPGDRLLFGPSGGSLSTCYPGLTPDGLFPFGLNNSGDLIRLSNAGGALVEVDFRTWTIGNGISWEQDDAVVPDSGTWCFADATEVAPNGDLGTPGLPNGACPVIVDTDTDTDTDLPPDTDTDIVVPPTASNLFFTEIMDYGPDFNLRFVEIYNAESSAVDLTPYAVLRYSNGGTTSPGVLPLSGSVAAGDVFVLGTAVAQEAAYDAAFGDHPDAYNSGVNANGDDVYILAIDDGAGGWTTIDVYGVFGVDGTGMDWEYLDEEAIRSCTVTAGTATFNVAEWTIVPTPGSATLGSWTCP